MDHGRPRCRNNDRRAGTWNHSRPRRGNDNCWWGHCDGGRSYVHGRRGIRHRDVQVGGSRLEVVNPRTGHHKGLLIGCVLRLETMNHRSDVDSDHDRSEGECSPADHPTAPKPDHLPGLDGHDGEDVSGDSEDRHAEPQHDFGPVHCTSEGNTLRRSQVRAFATTLHMA